MAKKKKTTTTSTTTTTTQTSTVAALGNFFVPVVLATQPTVPVPTTTTTAPAPTTTTGSTTPVQTTTTTPVITTTPQPEAALPTNAIKVSTAAELVAALKAAKGGETIALNGGNYGDVVVEAINPGLTVNIVAASSTSAATLRSLNVKSSSNLSFKGLSVQFTPDQTSSSNSFGVAVRSSSKVTIDGFKIKGGLSVNGISADAEAGTSNPIGNVIGYPVGYGFVVEKSTDVNLRNSSIDTFDRGIIVSATTDFDIENNEVHNLRRTFLVGADVHQGKIDGNHFSDTNPWKTGGLGDHADHIFIYNAAGQTKANDNIKITNNYFAQGKGVAVLGIVFQTRDTEAGHTNIEIKNNVFNNSSNTGIYLQHTQAKIENNTLTRTAQGDTKSAPGIVVTGSRSNALIKNNLTSVVSVINGAVATQEGNILIQRDRTSFPGYYTKETVYYTYDQVFTNGLKADPSVSDFTISSSGSSIVKSGVGVSFTEMTSSAVGASVSVTSTSTSTTSTTVAPTTAKTTTDATATVTSSSSTAFSGIEVFGSSTPTTSGDIAPTTTTSSTSLTLLAKSFVSSSPKSRWVATDFGGL
jgi:hypothetical protein